MDPLLYAGEHDLDRQLFRRRGDRMKRRESRPQPELEPAGS